MLITRNHLRLFALAAFLFALTSGQSLAAQEPRRESLEQHVRELYGAWASGDPAKVAAIDDTAPGFGYRQRSARSVRTPSAYLESLKAFFGSLNYYRISIDELQTDVTGDVGLAWGVHTEEFQVKGRRAEKVRVRFTMTFRYEGQRWRTLLYHRDIQPFDKDGTYIPHAP
jgi:hypothetical protein